MINNCRTRHKLNPRKPLRAAIWVTLLVFLNSFHVLAQENIEQQQQKTEKGVLEQQSPASDSAEHSTGSGISGGEKNAGLETDTDELPAIRFSEASESESPDTNVESADQLPSDSASDSVAPEAEELPEHSQTLPVSDAGGVAQPEQDSSQVEQSEADLVDAGQDIAAPLSQQVENLKQTVLDLNRDLLILEEELLFPANTQVALFLSMDVGEFFQLDAVKVKIDDKLVASHLYTERQVDALFRGGVQRLFIGNLKSGSHEITAFFTGKGPEGREYKRGATITLEKNQEPKMLELRIVDSTTKLQPVFDIKEWQL